VNNYTKLVTAMGWVLYFLDVALNEEKHLMTVISIPVTPE